MSWSTTAGTVTLDSPQCQASFAFYDDLVRTASVPGAQDVDTTRATYFAGKAATMIWSSFILDELAGLRADAAPSCPECAADPRFLVDNTGVVTALSGPDATEPAQFGEIVSWTVVADAATPIRRRRFVEFMMNDGYPDWLGFAPEGKIPARTGTPEEPAQVLHAVAHAAGGCRHQEAAGRLLPAGRCSTRSRAASTRSAGGASPRARARWSGPRSASCRYRRRSPR